MPTHRTRVLVAAAAALVALTAAACAADLPDTDPDGDPNFDLLDDGNPRSPDEDPGATAVFDDRRTAGVDDPAFIADQANPTTSEAPRPPGPLPVAVVGPPIVMGDEPVDIAVHPVTDAMYVIERLGTLRRIDNGRLGPILLDLDVADLAGVEEGLLGMAFSPDGSRVYLNTAIEGRTTITEYTVTPDGGIDTASGREVLSFDQPYEAHNGGDLLFGPDGLLYVFTGDGGFVGDPDRVALDLSSPLGKVLRLDPTPDGDRPHTVPADNPYVGIDGAFDLIWSFGLRNPWRAAFDPLTGDLWIGDVGDFAWEEVNVAWADEGAGRNVSFGWSAFEGTARYNEDQPAAGHQAPFFEYPHGEAGCSISGGAPYRGSAIDHLDGWYVFSDFCTGIVRALEVTDDREPGRIVEFGAVPFTVAITPGPGGELFVISVTDGIHPLLPG